MNLEDLDRMLLATLDDQQLTRGERHALAQTIADEKPDAHQLGVYRNRAFEIARQHIDRRTQTIDWLEEITKVFTPAAPITAIDSQAFFTPGDDCPGRVVDLLRNAKRCVDICVFTITYDKIASAIIQAHQRGVMVRVITDEEKSRDVGSDVERMLRHGVNVRLERSEYHMHHKFALFDDATLLNGSYNWTRGASVNNQESIIVTNDPALIKSFSRVFSVLWTQFT